MQPIMLIVTKLEGLEGFPITMLPVVEFCADTYARVNVFEETPKVGHTHRLRKYADRDGHVHVFSVILCSKLFHGVTEKSEK